MYSASQHVVIDAPPEEVFKVVGGFYTLSDWHPLCEDPPEGPIANEPGVLRRKNRIVGSDIDNIEDLVHSSLDPEDLHYVYEYRGGMFDSIGYRATIRCTPTNGGKSTVVLYHSVWDSEEEGGGADAVNNFYRVGLDAAKELIEGREND